MSINNIRNFIGKYKNTDKMWEAYCEFEYSWLSNINESFKRQVEIEWECISSECRIGDGGYEYEILRDFIKSLEDMLRLMN